MTCVCVPLPLSFQFEVAVDFQNVSLSMRRILRISRCYESSLLKRELLIKRGLFWTSFFVLTVPRTSMNLMLLKSASNSTETKSILNVIFAIISIQIDILNRLKERYPRYLAQKVRGNRNFGKRSILPSFLPPSLPPSLRKT